jgi:hypothetical protein
MSHEDISCCQMSKHSDGDSSHSMKFGQKMKVEFDCLSLPDSWSCKIYLITSDTQTLRPNSFGSCPNCKNSSKIISGVKCM